MKVSPTAIPEVLLIALRVFGDERGFFVETWNERSFARAGIAARFVQDNHSRSARGVLRGLHYQLRHPQGKLVRVIAGDIFDVAVDLRRDSPTFRKSAIARLSAASKEMLWVPPDFAHGFLVLSDYAEVLYKATDFYAPEHERSILWNDPELAIPWPVSGEPLLSSRDARAPPLRDAELP